MLPKLPAATARLLSLAFAALLAGCQSAPPAPPSAAELAQKALAIEQASIRDLTLIRECHALGGAVAAQASAVRRTWNFVNQPLSDRAQGFLAQWREDFIEIEDRQVSVTMLKRLHQNARSAREQLNLDQRVASVKPQVCQRHLTRVEGRNYAAEFVSPRLSNALAANGVSERHYLSIQVAGELYRDWPEPGRSFFSASERLEQDCPGDTGTLTLYNQWPLEIYARYCPDAGPSVLRCEWGKCQRLPLTDNPAKTPDTE